MNIYATPKQLAKLCDRSARWITERCCEGEIPGAHQPGGNGGTWSIDKNQFREWWLRTQDRPNSLLPYPETVSLTSGQGVVKAAKCWVYFVKCDKKQGGIKIGTAQNPLSRLQELQVGSFDRLILVCAIPGTQTMEKRLHEKFSHVRVRGEWFSPAPDLRAYIKRLYAHHKKKGKALGRKYW